jgi:hypothetical protein
VDVRKSAAAVEAPHDVDGIGGLRFGSTQIGVQGGSDDEHNQSSDTCRGAIHTGAFAFEGLSPSVIDKSQVAELRIAPTGAGQRIPAPVGESRRADRRSALFVAATEPRHIPT